MEIICLIVGDLQTNCYLVTDSTTRQTLIIDPGDEADFISTTLLEKKLKPQAIILTHGHYDHCLGVLELKLNFNLPIYLHQADNFLYQKAHQSAKHFSNVKIPKLPPIDHFLTNNQKITFGQSSLYIVHTPGHTPGSCCFLVAPVKGRFGEAERGFVFTGDTLFATGPGKADHSYSSKPNLQNSIKKISNICDLSSETYLYPGHEDYEFLLSNQS